MDLDPLTAVTPKSMPKFTAIEKGDAEPFKEVSKRELWSWYWYDFATQPFCSAAVAIFIPLILETLAYDAGHMSDGSQCPVERSEKCLVWFLGKEISPVSFALYVSSISVALQVVFFISLASLGDHGNKRKIMLTIFTILTGLTAIGFLAVVNPQLYYFAAVLAIMSNVCYGISTVMYYAYLPVLAISSVECADDTASVCSQDEILPIDKDFQKLRDEKSNDMSIKGSAMGNGGAVIVILIVGGILMILDNQSTYLLQACVAFTGVWALVFYFTLVFPFLKSRPGPAMPEGEWFLVYSWKKTFSTFRKCYELKHTFTMLVSWFFFSDGFNTIVAVAILFGKSALHMDDAMLLLIAFIAPVASVFGNMFFLHVLSNKLKLQSKTILLMLLFLGSLIPLYGLIGFLTPDNIPIGIKTVEELFVVATYFGFLFGAVQSYSRSFFGSLIPPTMESELFGLFEIGDKGSSWLGPLLVGLLTDAYGSIRYGFFAVLALLLIAVIPLVLVDPVKGKEKAQNYTQAKTLNVTSI